MLRCRALHDGESHANFDLRTDLNLLWKGFCQEAWLFWSSHLLSAGADKSYGTADALVGCSTVDQTVIRGSSPHDADSVGELPRSKGARSHGG